MVARYCPPSACSRLQRYRLPALLWRHRNDDALDELLEPLQRIRAKDNSGPVAHHPARLVCP
ncbi:hypothetical protein [Pseudomonas peli]|uniref:hypothetical protein n=1 Tax=Pseudomonas peli TaxID=592361 RepID=UPI0024ACD9A2|nr:hypothetical protein [Pseudomonas peli]